MNLASLPSSCPLRTKKPASLKQRPRHKHCLSRLLRRKFRLHAPSMRRQPASARGSAQSSAFTSEPFGSPFPYDLVTGCVSIKIRLNYNIKSNPVNPSPSLQTKHISEICLVCKGFRANILLFITKYFQDSAKTDSQSKNVRSPHAAFSARAIDQSVPPCSTSSAVFNMILMSTSQLRSTMYLISSATQSSKSISCLRGQVCQKQVRPGVTVRRCIS